MLDLYAGLIQINIGMVLYLHDMQMFVYYLQIYHWVDSYINCNEYP